MKRKILYYFICFSFLFPLFLHAKVGDPPSIKENGIEYKSHLNYVEAVSLDNDTTLWKTVLPEFNSSHEIDKSLEIDVQIKKIDKLESNGKYIVATYQEHKFYLSKSDGNIIR